MRIYDKIGLFIVVLLNEIQLLRKHNRIGCVGGGRICPYPNLGLWHGQKVALSLDFQSVIVTICAHVEFVSIRSKVVRRF